MDRLNYECLEYIFGFLNCGPREWLLLSRVCKQWREVFLRFWKRITIIEINGQTYQFDRCQSYLSTQRMVEILEYAAEYVTELNITKREKISGIKLGNSNGTQTFNLSGFDLEAFLESLSSNSTGKILKANVLPDQPFLKYLIKSNQNLQELTLTLDKNCFVKVPEKRVKLVIPKFPSKYNLRSRQIELRNATEVEDEHSVDEDLCPEIGVHAETERLNHKELCVNLCKQIFDSFAGLQKLTVSFFEVTDNNLDMFRELLSSFSRSRSTELRVQTCSGTDVREVLLLLSQFCFRDLLQINNAETFRLRKYGSHLNLDITLTASLKRFKVKSMAILYGWNWRGIFNMVTLYKFLSNTLFSMQKFEIMCLNGNTIENVDELIYLLVYAAKTATFHNRKVVINELIEITIKVQEHQCKTFHDPIFSITVSLQEERVEAFQQKLEQKLPKCKVITIAQG